MTTAAFLVDGVRTPQGRYGGVLAGIRADDLAAQVVNDYEVSVELKPNPIEGERLWTAAEHEPGTGQTVPLKNAAHRAYARSVFNKDELEFAYALDGMNMGVWVRNPARGAGYGIPLAVKVGDSSAFFPDFIWWIGHVIFAIDPTGRHILEEKVRGKLLPLDKPRVVLIIRGQISNDWAKQENDEGWTMVRQRTGRKPAPEHFENLNALLKRLTDSVTR